jgi:mannose-6-phosphate isomerase-like protein (cupin superfamily)
MISHRLDPEVIQMPMRFAKKIPDPFFGLLLVVGIGGVAMAQAPAQPAPAAPAPGSPATYKSAKELADALNAAKAGASGMNSSAVANTDQYRINVVHRVKPAGALAHAGNTELHYIIDGAATVVTGGSIVRGATPGLATIENGVTQKVAKGDVVIVPANSPHWYSAVEGSVTYLEVRWLAPVK